MKVAAVLQTGLLGLASLPGTHTHPGAVAVAVRQPKHHHLVQAAIPALVVFHETNGTLGGNSSNIAVCTAPTYDNVSPLRTRISRDDCHDLANKVLRRAGYWEMAQWTGVVATSANDGRDNGTHAGLVSEGTCQFAVARSWDEKLVYDQARDKVFLLASSSSSLSLGPVINNQTASAVAVMGSKDVYNILHAAVYDKAYQSDEPYMDRMTTQGRVSCQFAQGARTTISFKLQYVGDDDSDDDDN